MIKIPYWWCWLFLFSEFYTTQSIFKQMFYQSAKIKRRPGKGKDIFKFKFKILSLTIFLNLNFK